MGSESTSTPSQSKIIRPIEMLTLEWRVLYLLLYSDGIMGSTTTTKKNGRSLMFRIKSIPVGIALLTLCAPNLSTRAADLNDYSTSARVDYVFGCMKANGET